MAKNVLNGSKVSAANGIKNMFAILELISLNMQKGFAHQFFFTELYKRKEYCNPRLVKESKYFYTYLCEGKKLKIRKIYTGMDKDVQNAKEVSSQRASYIKYFFALDGSVETIEFEIYFDKSSDRVEQEIQYIFASLNDGITSRQTEKFIQDTQATIQGNYTYNKLQTGNYSIILATSDGYAHIHN